MKTVVIGGFVDYQIQLAKALARHGDDSLVDDSLVDDSLVDDSLVDDSLVDDSLVDDSLVVIYTMAESLPEENLKAAGGLKLRLLSRCGPIYNPFVLIRFLQNASRTLREIREFKPDVVHLQIGSSMLALMIPFLGRYPIVTTFHDVKPHSGEAKAWERYAHAYIRDRSARLLVHGEKLREALVMDYGVPEWKAVAIPMGPHNIEAFLEHAQPDLKEDGNVVLFFGRILDYKGLEYLIKAEPLITRAVPDARIIIAGAGDAKKYEEMMVHRDRFTILNRHISYKEGAELFQRCSVVALPYVEASQSGVVSTAYGFGKAVVATSAGSVEEMVDHEKSGLVVPPRDSEALAAAIVRLLKDPELRKRLGENARRKLDGELSWENVVRRTLDVYRSAINGQSNTHGPADERSIIVLKQ